MTATAIEHPLMCSKHSLSMLACLRALWTIRRLQSEEQAGDPANEAFRKIKFLVDCYQVHGVMSGAFKIGPDSEHLAIMKAEIDRLLADFSSVKWTSIPSKMNSIKAITQDRWDAANIEFVKWAEANKEGEENKVDLARKIVQSLRRGPGELQVI